MLPVKVELIIIPLAPLQSIPPPLLFSAVLPVKTELIIVPLSPLQATPPPKVFAVLLMKLQFFNVPSFPFHSIAPP